MLGFAYVLFVGAVVAGILGFMALAGLAAGIAKIVFVVLLIAFVISFSRSKKWRKGRQ